jgi:hypothetical protein
MVLVYTRVQQHGIFRFCDWDKEILLLLHQVLIIQDQYFLSLSPKFENEAECPCKARYPGIAQQIQHSWHSVIYICRCNKCYRIIVQSPLWPLGRPRGIHLVPKDRSYSWGFTSMTFAFLGFVHDGLHSIITSRAMFGSYTMACPDTLITLSS